MEQKENQSINGKLSRQSGIEILRIFMMLVIIAHHYVVNSGLMEVIEANALSSKSIFLLIFGWGGKYGINCFVLITGYFMCKQHITWKKYLKLLLEIEFYNIGIGLIFLITGYGEYSIKTLAEAMLPIHSIGTEFLDSYLVLFLLIPFLNLLIQGMDERQHLCFMVLCLFVFTVLPSLFKENVKTGYIGWFAIVYICASYIRLYPKKWFDNNRIWGSVTICLFLLSWGSVAAGAWLCEQEAKASYFPAYYFVIDCNKILAFLPAVATFLFFRNLQIGHRKWINNIAATTLGMLLIHANSNSMRQWLWQDVLKNVEYFYSEYLILHAVLSVIGVYLICVVIDLVRIHFLEKPLEKFVQNYRFLHDKNLNK